MSRFARTVPQPDAVYARRLATAYGQLAKAQREEVGLAEPETDGTGSGAAAGADQQQMQHHDATGIHGGDDYQSRDERLAADAVQITSMRGLMAHAGKEIDKQMTGVRAAEDSRALMLLGARYEGLSRGVDPAPVWLARRAKGLMGSGDGENEDPAAAQVASAAADGSSASIGAAITDPSRTDVWGTEEAAVMATADGRWSAAEAVLRGPYVIVEAAVEGGSGATKAPATASSATPVDGSCGASAKKNFTFFGSSKGKDNASSSSSAVASGPRRPGSAEGLRWHTLASIPLSEASATASSSPAGGAEISSDLKLPSALLADVPASGMVSIRIRCRESITPGDQAGRSAVVYAAAFTTESMQLTREQVAALVATGAA